MATGSSERWSGLYAQDQIAIGQYLGMFCCQESVTTHARGVWLDIAYGVPLQDGGADVRWDHASSATRER